MHCNHCTEPDQNRDHTAACISCVCKKRLDTKSLQGNIYPAWCSQFFKAFFSTRVTTTCWCMHWIERLLSRK